MATRCAPAKLHPLSAEAQELARQNIQTVARFLAHHRLSDDWYDVVIFRYLLTAGKQVNGGKQRGRTRPVSLDAPLPGADGLTLGDTVTEDNLCYVPYQMMEVV